MQQPQPTVQAAPPTTWGCMVQARRWLVWREVPVPGKKPKKVPYYVNGTLREGTLDTAEDWTNFGTYEEACNRVAGSNGYYEGIAFALGPDEYGGCWQGVDLDDVPQHRLIDWANGMLGYVEFSPSGKGIHAIGYGRHFVALPSNGSGFEAYANGRYFTVTESKFRDAPITCLAELVEQRLAPLHGRAPQASSGVEAIQLPPQTVMELRSALFFMRADEYDLWQRMGQALAELGDVGRGMWIEWSTTSGKYSAAEAARKD